jgi:hypothetical protein
MQKSSYPQIFLRKRYQFSNPDITQAAFSIDLNNFSCVSIQTFQFTIAPSDYNISDH